MSKEQSTFLKGIAVILVIISHFWGGYNLRVFTPLGGVGVAMFLFLSGYGLSKSFDKSGLESYWWKKLTRIGIPWLIWCCMFFAISRCVVVLHDSSIILRYWYLEYLFVWYLLFWVCNKLFSKRISLIVYAISAVAMFFLWKNLQAEQSLSFVAGVALAEMERANCQRKRSSSKWRFAMPIALFVYATIFLALKQMPQIRAYGEESLFMKFMQLNIKFPYAMAAITAVFLNNTPAWLNKMICPIGVLSLELYLVQMQFCAMIESSYSNLIIISISVVVLSVILYFLSERLITLLKPIKIPF